MHMLRLHGEYRVELNKVDCPSPPEHPALTPPHYRTRSSTGRYHIPAPRIKSILYLLLLYGQTPLKCKK